MKIAEKKVVDEIWGRRNSVKCGPCCRSAGKNFKRKLGLDQVRLQHYGNGEDSGAPGEMMEQTVAVPIEHIGGTYEDNPIIPGGEDLITITNLNQLVKRS